MIKLKGLIVERIVTQSDFMKIINQAKKETGAKVRWGAAWNIDNIAEWERPMEDAMNNYIDIRRSQGRRPFIDGPHFELMEI